MQYPSLCCSKSLRQCRLLHNQREFLFILENVNSSIFRTLIIQASRILQSFKKSAIKNREVKSDVA